MSFTHKITYDTASHFVFDTALVEVSGGLIRLKDLGGATYSTANPTVQTQNTFKASALTTFAQTASIAGSDAVKYILEVDGTNKYWDGSAWANSDGTYDQSNTAAEVNTNAPTLSMSEPSNIRVMAFLHSATGTTRPTLTDNTVGFSFVAETATAINECIIQSYLADIGLDLLNITTYEPKIYVKASRAFTHGNRLIAPFIKTASYDATGYVQISVLETESVGEKFEIFVTYNEGNRIKMLRFERAVIPNQASATLPEVAAVSSIDVG